MTRRNVLSGAAVLAVAAGLATAASLTGPAQARPTPAVVVPVDVPDTLLACPGPPVLSGSAGDTAVGAVGTGSDEDATDEQFRQDAGRTVASTWVVAPADTAHSLATAPSPATAPGPATAPSTAPSTPAPGPSGGAPDAVAAGRAGDLVARRVDVSGKEGGGALSVRAVPRSTGQHADRAVAQVGALSVASTAEGDLRGLAATACAEPAAESWLVGGGTGPGRSARLVLQNPGATPATVDVELLTGAGPLAPAAAAGLVVPPQQRREVLLEGLAPDEEELAVRVRASGGRVAAFLLDSWLQGLVPAGVDVVAPGAAPSTTQAVPAVLRRAGTRTTLRLATPGTEDAVVTWRLMGAEGQVAGGDAAVTVPAGAVVDVDLSSAPEGGYTAVVESTVPVVAAVGLLHAAAAAGAPADGAVDGARPTDLAWSPAATPLRGATNRAVVALPADAADTVGEVTASLVLAALTAQEQGGSVTVEVVPFGASGRAGAATTLEVPVGRSLTLPATHDVLAGARAVTLSVDGGTLVSGLVLESGSLLSTVAVRPVAAAPAPVEVRRGALGSWP